MGFFQSATNKHSQNLDEEKLYSIVADELSRNSISQGLYAKAQAESAGDESKARARYIKLRVDILRSERAAVFEQQQQLEKQKVLQQKISAQTPASPPEPEIRTASDIRGRRILVAFISLFCAILFVGGLARMVSEWNFSGLFSLISTGLVGLVFGWMWKMYTEELN